LNEGAPNWNADSLGIKELDELLDKAGELSDTIKVQGRRQKN